jgi:RNA polymerase sigma factor (sigma-70 family)
MPFDLRVETRFKNSVLYRALAGLPRVRGDYGDKDFTLGKAAAIIGVPYSTLSDYLNLRRSPYVRKSKYSLRLRLSKTAQMIVDELGIQPDELFPPSLYDLALPSVEVREYDSKQVLSLGDLRGADRISMPDPNATIAAEEMKAAVNRALEKLTPRQQDIIEMRFGLNGRDESTLEEVAREFHVGPERIRQIEARVLRTLRHPGHHYEIRQYA